MACPGRVPCDLGAVPVHPLPPPPPPRSHLPTGPATTFHAQHGRSPSFRPAASEPVKAGIFVKLPRTSSSCTWASFCVFGHLHLHLYLYSILGHLTDFHF